MPADQPLSLEKFVRDYFQKEGRIWNPTVWDMYIRLAQAVDLRARQDEREKTLEDLKKEILANQTKIEMPGICNGAILYTKTPLQLIDAKLKSKEDGGKDGRKD